MKLIGIETVTKFCGIGLAEDAHVLVEQNLNVGLKHNELLFSLITQSLKYTGWKLTDINGIVVDIGPGSFTGIRLGISVARSLAQTLNLPLCGVNCFDVIRYNILPLLNTTVYVLIPALRNMVYVNKHEVSIPSVRANPVKFQLLDFNVWLHQVRDKKHNLSNTFLMGEAVEMYRSQLSTVFPTKNLVPLAYSYPSVTAVLRLGYKRFTGQKTNLEFNFNRVRPLYIRPAAAVEQNQKN